jgi:hypothetical protein
MRAASSPTLFATASGIDGLAAGPAGGFPRTAVGVRPLSPVRQTPAGARHARLGSDTPAKTALFASPPATARSAAAVSRAFASRYGSDLLSPSLHSLCSRATPFLAPPGLRRLSSLCQARCLPVCDRLLRAPVANGSLMARLARAGTHSRAGSR